MGLRALGAQNVAERGQELMCQHTRGEYMYYQTLWFFCLFVFLTRKQQICHCDSILFSLIWDRFLAMPIVLLPDLGLAFYTYRTLSYLQENKLVWQ